MELESFLMDIEEERKRRIQTQHTACWAVVAERLPIELIRFVSWEICATVNRDRFFIRYTMSGVPTWSNDQSIVFRVDAYQSEIDGCLVVSSQPKRFSVYGANAKSITVATLVSALSFLPAIILDDDTKDIQTTLIGALEV